MGRSWLRVGLGRRRVRPSDLLVLLGLCIFVAAVYLLVVVGGGAAFELSRRPNLALSVLATAIVALSIAPVQSRLKRLATRLVGSEVRSPFEVLDQFAAGGSYTDDQLPSRMARSLADATGAAGVQVWLVVAGAPTLAASWPLDAAADPDPPTVDGRDPGERRHIFPVRYGNELFALLRLHESDQPLTPIELRLAAGLAAKAGLVLRIAALRAELSRRRDQLSARTEELRSSRLRLIETQDRERRQLERDIHDGAQQQLVALAINLRLAQAVCLKSPERGFAVLGEQGAAAADAIAALSQLSRGIYPRSLEEDGLLPAIRAAAASSPSPIEVSGDESLRLPRELDAALYFCCLEALQNAAKHAEATQITVALVTRGDDVVLTITDDGRGFETTVVDSGTGLANIRDRVDAAGGVLELHSTPGRGTRIEIRVPAVAGVPA